MVISLKKRAIAIAVAAVMIFTCVPMLNTASSDVHAAGGSNSTKATNISIGGSASGKTDGKGNANFQWFKFTTSKISGMQYTVKCINEYSDREESLNYYIVDDNFKSVAPITDSYDPDRYVDGSDSVSMSYKLSANRTYYIKVQDWYSYVKIPYEVYVTSSIIKPAKGTISSVKAGKKKLTVKYKKKAYGERYQIAVKKKGGSWKVYNNGNKLKKTVKKLKKGKKYSVKVRAQRQVNGKWYSGKWSKAKTVKVK